VERFGFAAISVANSLFGPISTYQVSIKKLQLQLTGGLYKIEHMTRLGNHSFGKRVYPDLTHPTSRNDSRWRAREN
jgi:hypothetical protein